MTSAEARMDDDNSMSFEENVVGTIAQDVTEKICALMEQKSAALQSSLGKQNNCIKDNTKRICKTKSRISGRQGCWLER